jgi:glycosyltransferase involved in cell wall biosynthesis
MDTDAPDPAQPVLVSVGRLIPEKQTAAIVPALAHARQRLPTLRAVIYGDGPQREAIARAARAADLDAVVACPGFVAAEIVTATLRRALCLVLLSRREGYGLVVAEAAAQGVPSVVLRHPDSAAAELIVEGVNGTLCASADPADVASAILRIHNAGDDLRQSTLAWFRANAGTLTVDASLPRVLAIYRDGASEGRNGG